MITHEREAEELRAGVEKLCKRADRSADIDRDVMCVPVDDLLDLLDRVDARDSLKFLEDRERRKKRRPARTKRKGEG